MLQNSRVSLVYLQRFVVICHVQVKDKISTSNEKILKNLEYFHENELIGLVFSPKFLKP